jgi:hypothetical protein
LDFLHSIKLVTLSLSLCLSLQNGTSGVRENDVENGSGSAEIAKAGTAGYLIELENRRAIKVGDFD